MKCYRKQIDNNFCSLTYGQIREIEIECPAGILCEGSDCDTILLDVDITYSIKKLYVNDYAKDILIDTIAINHYCKDGVTVVAVESAKVLSNGAGSYYTTTNSLTLTGNKC